MTRINNPYTTFICFLFLIGSYLSFSQETTGSLEGRITDTTNFPLEAATIILTDTETNFKYGTLSKTSGFYTLNGIPPGTQYTLEVQYIGYQTFKVENVTINLGKITNENAQLKEDNALDDVVITVNKSTRNNGNNSLISNRTINNTPTISRSIQDLTKNLPEANLNSFAGASNRFNNLNIDGIANNDVIGFQEPASGASGSSANGTPGSLSRTQPIGIGAIKEVSVKTAPFDVSIGNFTGANINLVTKNGTNKTKKTVYFYGTNQILNGVYANGKKQVTDNFYDFQVGGGIGGALKKDKLFYYVNFEQALSELPLLNAPGSNTSNISLATVNQISDFLKTRYNYDPGTFTQANIKTASSKLFLRLDYNVSDTHQITLRNNYVKSFADNLEWNESIFNFGNQGYRHHSVANSLAFELNSKLSSNTNNSFTIGYNKVKEHRDFDGRVFPHIDISDASNSIFAGTYREASVYNTDLNALQITNNLTLQKNLHNITLGGLLQYNDINYGFLTAWNGRWQYRSVSDFLDDRPARIRGVYHITNNSYNFVNNRPSATIDALTSGLYVQDRFRVHEKLTLTGGLRLDMQHLLDPLPLSNEVRNTPEFSSFKNKINNRPNINPRLGFNYKPNSSLTIDGGSGLFTGRIPYLWFAYAEYISGTEYFNIDLRPNGPTPIVENLADLSSQQPNLTEINLIDNDFDLPREWKTNVNFKLKLPKALDILLSATYTDVIKGIYFKSINREQNIGNFTGADNRPYFLETGEDIKINTNFTNVFLLTNTNKGYRYNLTASIFKKTKHYQGSLGYTYGKSKDISSTVRNSPAANYEWNQAIVANDPELSFSNFDLRHKIVSSHSYTFNINERNQFLMSFLYSGTSGGPISFVYRGDVNRDGSSRNDLIYIPRDASEINLVPITDSQGNVTVSAQEQWNQLNSYIENNNYLNSRRGQYAERNGAKTPWNHQLDTHLEYGLKLNSKHKLRFSLDMLNVLNFINKNWGRLVFVPNVVNSSFSLLDFKGIENEQPTYQFKVTDTTPWVIDTQNSRWRAQLGVALEF